MTQHRFFHNQLEFIEVFKERGGFDIAVGNPPWLKIQFEEKGLMSEVFPELDIRKTTAPEIRKLQASFLSINSQKFDYCYEYTATESLATFINGDQNYPLLIGQQNNLYKCVLESCFSLISKKGFIGLIHPEGVFEDPRGQPLRKEIFKRLVFHFQFLNVFKLFSEVHHRLTYSVNIYSKSKNEVDFISVNNILSTNSLNQYFTNRSSEDLSLLSYDHSRDKFEWNLKGNSNRLIKINNDVLEVISKIFNDDDPNSTKLISIHANSVVDVFQRFSEWDSSLSSLSPLILEGFHETEDVKKGMIKRETRYTDLENEGLVFSGSHISLGNSFFKTPKEKCKENSDYDVVDVAGIGRNYSPRSNYILSDDFFQKVEENGIMKTWYTDYKVGFRKMLNLDSERTLQPALLPRNTGHINGIISLTLNDYPKLIDFLGLSSSVIFDFLIKTIGSSNFTGSRMLTLPCELEKKVFRQYLFENIEA